MNLAVPGAPQGPRALQGGGDGTHGHARDKAAAQDFAAALSESASDYVDVTASDDGVAKSTDVDGIAARLSRRFNGKEGQGSADNKENAATGESLDVGSNSRATIISPTEALSALAVAGANAGSATSPAAEPGPGAAMRDALAARDLQGVRDLLVVLAPEATAQPEKPAPLDDLMARLGKHLPETARAALPMTGAAVFAEDGPANFELLANISDEVLASAKVVRQETHFQPVGQDVRRLPSMSPTANDDQLMEMSLAAAARPERQAAGGRDQRDAPIPTGRPIEATVISAPATNSASAVGGEQPLQFSVGHQIADGVQRALAATAPSESAAPRPAPQPEAAVSTTFAPALRTIKLQLNPLSLGIVTVVLSGRDAELSIRLEAELPETVGKVEQDRAVLTARLAGAGYGVSEVTIGRIGASTDSGVSADQRDSGGRAGSQPHDDGGRGRSSEGGASSSSEDRAGRRGAPGSRVDDGVPPTRGGAAEHSAAGNSFARRFRPV